MDIFFNSNGDFIWASVAAIVAALSGIASFWFSYKSNKNTKEALENTKEATGKQLLMEQSKIDASIIATSRIDWIENVRTLAADIISYYYNLKLYENIEYKNKIELKRKSELLKLYFSSSDKIIPNDTIITEITKQLKEASTNDKKNGYIRQYIDTLVSEALSSNYVKNNRSIISHENRIKQNYSTLYDLEEEIYDNVYNDQAGEDIQIVVDRQIPLNKEYLAGEIWSEINFLKNNVKKLNENNKNVEELFVNFGEIISIYLKIEWEIAKTGK